MASAVDGDTVKLEILPTRHGDHPEGQILEVIKRNRTRYVGKIELSKNFAFVVPDYRKMHQDFFVYPENINNARNGDLLGPRSQLVSTNESSGTMIVATCGPKSRTPANTKASETEIRASTEGTLILKEPVRRVSATRTNQSEPTGCWISSKTDWLIASVPSTMTDARYTRAEVDRSPI